MTHFSRRVLLQSLAAASAALWARPLRARAGPAGAADRLRALFRDRAALTALGDACRAACATGGEVDLARCGLNPTDITGLTDDELRGLLRRLFVADFAAGRVVDVAGWRVAENEARLYAALSGSLA